eukprot:403345918
MSYFLNRLKEQASSIQSIAKNIIVYENKDANQNDSEGEEEEVLDQMHDGDDDSQLQGKEVIKSKATTSSKSSSNQLDTNSKGKGNQSLKDQTDDFFNSFIPALQQKAKIVSGSKSQENENKNIGTGNSIKNGQKQTDSNSLEEIKSQSTSNNHNSDSLIDKPSTSTKQQQQVATGKQSVVASDKGKKLQNESGDNSKNSSKTQSASNNQKYEMEEFEEKIKMYQNILSDNEKTIEKFRNRVISLEQELVNLKEQQQSSQNLTTAAGSGSSSQELQPQNPLVEAQPSNLITQETLSFMLQQKDEMYSDQMHNLLEIIQEERKRVQERERDVRELQARVEELSNLNHSLKITNHSKIQDIENILNNLVQTASNQLEQKIQIQKEQELQLLQEQQQVIQQQQISPQKQQNNQSKGKKGKKNQQNKMQQQIEQQMKEKIEQEQLALQQQQQQQPLQNDQVQAQNLQPLDSITPDQLSQIMTEILSLLKPTQAYRDDQENIEAIMAKLEDNNKYLKEINLQISDKMLSLEQIYQEKMIQEKGRLYQEFQDKIEQMNQDFNSRSSGYEEKILQIQNQSESGIESRLQQLRDEYEVRIAEITQDYENKLTELSFKNVEDLEEQKKQHEVELENKVKEILTQNKSWENNYQKIQEQHKQDQLEIKKHVINQVFNELQQSLSKTFELTDIKLAQSEEIETLISSFTSLIKENFKSGAQIDPQNIQAMKDCWDQVCERFKPFNLSKYQKQSTKDATQWITQRFGNIQPLKGKKQQDSFKDSDLCKFYDVQLQTILSLNQYIQEQAAQLTDAQTKKDSIQQQFTKLQKECNDLSLKQKDIPKLQQKIDQFTQEKEVIQAQLSEVLQQKLDSQMKLEEGRNKTEMLVVENATLKEKVGTLDEDTKRLRKQNKQLQGQLDLQEDYKLQHEKASQELKWMEAQLKSKESELEESRKTLSLLQRSIQNQQDEYEQNLRVKEREQSEDKQLLQSLQLQINEMKERIRVAIDVEQQLERSKRYAQEIEIRIEKLDVENSELKKYSQELVEKVKKDSEQNEYMVDRRIINKFLVNYVNQNSSREIKLQMLDSMSRILAFSMDEKITLGLVKKQILADEGSGNTASSLTGAAVTQQTVQKGIGEKLISFFLQDDDE